MGVRFSVFHHTFHFISYFAVKSAIRNPQSAILQAAR